MLPIDLRGKRAFVAGVSDDGGFGFSIAKSLAEAGASVCLGSWPPALGIFQKLLERGKMDASMTLSDGRKLEFEKRPHRGEVTTDPVGRTSVLFGRAIKPVTDSGQPITKPGRFGWELTRMIR